MRILSNFVDYYDNQGYLYGQPDSKVIYNRSPFGKKIFSTIDKMSFYIADVVVSMKTWEDMNFRYPLNRQYQSRFRWLVICGKPYTIFSVSKSPTNKDKFDIDVGPVVADFENDSLTPYIDKGTYWPTFRSNRNNIVDGEFMPQLLELSKKIHQPVFIINSQQSMGSGNCVVTVSGIIPKLGDLKIPRIVSQDQLYQELEYFMTNLINESPDLQPIGKPPMTDKEKILQHGFDLKQSFRHRI